MARPLHLVDPVHDLDTAPLRSHVPLDQIRYFRHNWISAGRIAWRLWRGETSSRTLHAWSEGGLRAALMCPKDWPIVYHISAGPSRDATWMLRLIDSGRLLHVHALTSVLRQRAIGIGLTPSRCEVDPPDIELLRIATDSTADPTDIRRALGLDDSDIALLLPGPETLDSGHRHAAWASALAHVLEPRHRLITWGTGRQVDRLRRFLIGLGHPNLLLVARDRLPDCHWNDLLCAADAVLCGDGRDQPILQIAGAAASGATVIAADTPALRAIEALDVEMRFAASDKPRDLAAAMLAAFETQLA